jgi:hypothetical protein
VATAERPSRGVRVGAGQARRISAGQDAAISEIALDGKRFAEPRAMLAGQLRRDVVLFDETFDVFAPGTRWRIVDDGLPQGTLKVEQDQERSALKMETTPAEDRASHVGIETISPFPLRDLDGIEASVVFRVNSSFPRSEFKAILLGSTNKAVRIVIPQLSRPVILADAIKVSADRHFFAGTLQAEQSPNHAFQAGNRYRLVLAVNRRNTRLTVVDDVNQSIVFRTELNALALADLGDSAAVLLRLTSPLGERAECLVYRVTVRGWRAATRNPPSKTPEASTPALPSGKSLSLSY